MEKLLTTSEVAEYFRVTPITVTSKFTKQGLKFFPLSCKEYRYNMKDIIAFEEKMKNNIKINKPIDSNEFTCFSKTKKAPIKFID